MRLVVFTHFKNRIHWYHWKRNTTIIILRHSTIMKIYIDFTIRRSYFSFFIFIIMESFAMKLFSMLWMISSQICLYYILSQQFISGIYLASSNIFCMSNHYKQWLNVIFTFVTNMLFITFFTNTNLVRYQYFINIFIVHVNKIFRIVKFTFTNLSIAKYYNFFINSLYYRQQFVFSSVTVAFPYPLNFCLASSDIFYIHFFHILFLCHILLPEDFYNDFGILFEAYLSYFHNILILLYFFFT